MQNILMFIINKNFCMLQNLFDSSLTLEYIMELKHENIWEGSIDCNAIL